MNRRGFLAALPALGGAVVALPRETEKVPLPPFRAADRFDMDGLIADARKSVGGWREEPIWMTPPPNAYSEVLRRQCEAIAREIDAKIMENHRGL